MRLRARLGLIDCGLTIAVVVVVASITYLYVSSERFFYYWDHASYQDIAGETALAFRESLAAGWLALRRSFQNDYNAVFALPLVPWILRFGSSRLSFELASALVYLVPLPLAVGAVATRLVPGRRRLAFWGAAWLALLTPMTWVPTLRGFPDAGAATLIALALFVYLGDPELRQGKTWLTVGVLLGLSVLFRRHFAYAVVAFFLSVVAHALGRELAAPPPNPRARRLASLALGLGGMAAASALVLFGLGWSYAQRFLTYDFHALYRPYEAPFRAVLAWYVAPYGWLTWIAAGSGILLGFLSRAIDKSALAFVGLFGTVSLVQWCWQARQIGEPYTVHFTTVIVLGLLTFCLALYDGLRSPWRPIAIGTIVGLALLNLNLGLSTPDVGRRSPLRPLFAARWAPLARHDYDEVLRLVRYLHDHAQGRAAVYVAASSHVLNPHIIRQADRLLSGTPQGKLKVLSVPILDSEGFYPLGELLEAQYVVLAQPFQHHLAREDQRLLRLVYDAFLDHWEIAQVFEESARLYDLDKCTGYVYQRRRPTAPAAALDTLRRMEQAMPERPGMQPDWVVVDQLFPSWLSRNADGTTSWAAHPARKGSRPWTTLATLASPPGYAEITGTVAFVDPRCQGATLAFSFLASPGQGPPLAEVRRRPGEDGRFRIELDAQGRDRLFLSLLEYADDASIDHCLLVVDPLVIR